MSTPAIHALGLQQQALHACADAGRVGVEALLYVVGAQHDDEQVDDLMAFEQRIGHAQRVHGFVDGVHKYGGPARKPLLGDQILFAQRLLQAAGPALVLVETDAAVGAVGRVGAIAVGVGVPQAENVFFHRFSSCCRK